MLLRGAVCLLYSTQSVCCSDGLRRSSSHERAVRSAVLTFTGVTPFLAILHGTFTAWEQELLLLHDLIEGTSLIVNHIRQIDFFRLHHARVNHRHLCRYPIPHICPGSAVRLRLLHCGKEARRFTWIQYLLDILYASWPLDLPFTAIDCNHKLNGDDPFTLIGEGDMPCLVAHQRFLDCLKDTRH